MNQLQSFIRCKSIASAFFTLAMLLMSSQLFAQTVNTATVTRPTGLVLTCVSGPAGTGLTYTSGAPASCSATDTDAPNPKLTVTKTASLSNFVVGKTGQFYTINIAIANAPTTAAITLSDILPANITLSGTPTATGGTMTGCPTSGNSLAGCSIAPTSGPIQITVPVNVGVGATTATNTATAAGGGDPLCTGTAPACSGTTPNTPVIDAIDETVTQSPRIATTTDVALNDTKPAGSVYTQTATTCSPAGTMTTAGIASYTTPVGNSSCTVTYTVCPTAGAVAALCDTAILTITTGPPVIAITTPITVAEGPATSTINVITLSAASASPVSVTLGTTFGTLKVAVVEPAGIVTVTAVCAV